jgi:hypothetical protein
MYDYKLEDSTGKITPIAEVSTAEITELLMYGFQPVGTAGVEAIRERLLLELFIRERSLR